MTLWVVLARIAMGADIIVVMCLIVYFDLRIHALVQSGDLPESTARPFRTGGWYSMPNFAVLSSRQFADIDGHTRLLVPLFRVALVLLIPLAGLMWVLKAA